MKDRRWKAVALISTGIMIGVVLVGSPAGAHVSSWAHNWTAHIKPRADARYDTKTLGRGKALTGFYSAWGTGGGFSSDAINFRQSLPAEIATGNTHFVPVGTTPLPPQCPGVGRAAAGHLCVYEQNAGARTFGSIFMPGKPGGPFGVQKRGFGIYFATTGTGESYSYGTWTVRAPTGHPAPRPALQDTTSSPVGG